ncbi:hypothetical protein BZG05_01540 [Salinivibrio kushneri]|uniref:hypothetical protein n=1 Tax=Salinivibrio kushneri TaxID=1908198 RepID=UPI0009892299|nr:hypothetical protein [Salinivibrio kushneri]OOE36192.1 hypothetical protein BZG05_01540 [Salinivibrio kushneri]
MEFIKGTHGTTCYAAESIEKQGFRSGSGLRGKGVYFWLYHYQALIDEAEGLAIAWWKLAKTRGDYAKHPKKECAIIHANIEAEPDNIYDLEANRQGFMMFQKEIAASLDEDEKMKPCERKELLSGLYDFFLEKVEEKLNRQFCAIKVNVQRPKGFNSKFDIDVSTSQSQCLVVRNIDIIQIEKITKPTTDC